MGRYYIICEDESGDVFLHTTSDSIAALVKLYIDLALDDRGDMLEEYEYGTLITNVPPEAWEPVVRGVPEEAVLANTSPARFGGEYIYPGGVDLDDDEEETK